MAREEDYNAVLSDVEEDDIPPATVMDTTSDSTDDVSVERFRELVTELDRERKAREAVEKAKSELQVSFNRLKVLAHEAIKKRDKISRRSDEVSRSNDNLFRRRLQFLSRRYNQRRSRRRPISTIEFRAMMRRFCIAGAAILGFKALLKVRLRM